jgi:hypothetical protein
MIYLLLLLGCPVDGPTVPEDRPDRDPPPHETGDSDPEADIDNGISLRAGLLNVNDIFQETGSTLYTCENSEGTNGQFALQVGAEITGPADYIAHLVRVDFSSDRTEWVGSVGGENEVYWTEEECLESGRYCEEIVVGEGTSGYFEIAGGHIAIQNIWCRYHGGRDYSYTVVAQGIDLNPWPTEVFTTTGALTIACKTMPCCPDNDYISEWGNHTVEPWECD